jgi:5-bromo-4-chloroindolyl phosphate hydrolysis protein
MEKEIAVLTRKLAEARAEIARLLKIIIKPDVVKEHEEYLKTLFVEAKP